MSENDELRNLIYIAAYDIAVLETDPTKWAPWLRLLVEALESEAYKRNLDPEHPAAVESMLARLRDALSDRLEKGRW